MSKTLSKLFILALLMGTMLFVIVKAEEEFCPLTRDESKPSCGGDGEANTDTKTINDEDDLIVEDEHSNSKDTSSSSSSKAKEGQCHTKNDGTKTCGEEIESEATKTNKPIDTKSEIGDIKTDYYKNKKKPIKKSQGEKVIYPHELKYEELFRQQGHEREEYLKSFTKDSNYTNYYDFSLDEEELEIVKKELYAVFPPQKFKFTNQGNFLHFYRTAYEKKLPVYFTTDSMLYALNENINRVTVNFLENVLFFSLKKLFETLVFQAEVLKEKPENENYKMILQQSQIYYGAGADFLSDGFHAYEAPEDVNQYIKGVTGLSKKFYTNTFLIMLKSRQINTKPLKPIGVWRRSRKMANIYMTLKFYQLVKLDMRADLKSIFVLGKLIVDSGSKTIFNEIRGIVNFLVGEDRNAPNFAEVYEIGKELGFGDEIDLSNDQIAALSKKINILVSGHKHFYPDLGFTNDFFLYSQENYDKFKHDREHTSYLFNKHTDLEDWVLNKLIEIKEEGPRLMISSYEMIDIMHHASRFRKWTFNRYKGLQTYANEQPAKFRDGIDMQENFEKAKYSIKNSMMKEPLNWTKNIQNYYHFLLYKSTRNIKHSTDPLYKSPLYKEKNFYTAWGAYTHFKRQMLLLTVTMGDSNPPDDETLGIPEVVLEPHLEFYRELEKFWNLFKDRILQFTLTSEFYMQINFQMVKNQLNNVFMDMTEAIDIVITGIKKQESGTLDAGWRKKINELIIFDVDHNNWGGWYVALYDRDHHDKFFDFDVWMASLANFPPVEASKFKGAVLFNTLKFSNIGLVVKEDPYEKTKKLLLFSGFRVGENYQPMDNNLDLEDLTKFAMDRL